MRILLILLNFALLAALAGVGFFWHPEPQELPLPGTYAEKLGRDIPAAAQSSRTGAEFEILDAYAPALPPGAKNGAVYLRMRNGTTRDVVLSGASSPVGDAVELHAHLDDGGVMRMRPVPEIAVAAGRETVLQPGGLHLMLIGLKQPLVAGATLALTLNFADGSSRDIGVPVR